MYNQVASFPQSNHPLRTSVSQGNICQLLSTYNPQKFKKGDYIFLPEKVSKHLYFIVEGKIKLGYYLDSGRNVTKSILGKGDIFGEQVLFGMKRHRYYASAWREATICMISQEEVKKVTKENPELIFFLMQKVGSDLMNKEKQIESLVFKNSRTRIIEFLLELARKKGRRVGYEKLVYHIMTHQEIADLTATSRQTVTTTISELRRKNLLIINRKRMLIRDMENLAAAI